MTFLFAPCPGAPGFRKESKEMWEINADVDTPWAIFIVFSIPIIICSFGVKLVYSFLFLGPICLFHHSRVTRYRYPFSLRVLNSHLSNDTVSIQIFDPVFINFVVHIIVIRMSVSSVHHQGFSEVFLRCIRVSTG